MIQLVKGAAPAILAQRAAEWTAELLAAIGAGKAGEEIRKARYNHQEIKAALLQETAGKCAYCESKFRHVAYGDIEHITPKSTDARRTYDWANLTMACDVCNTKKGDQDGIVDPYEVDPEAVHFRFMGPMVTVLNESETAKLAIAVLQLNRPELLERRKERIEDLSRRLGEVLSTKDAITRSALLKALVQGETQGDKEYAACARSYVRDKERDGAIPNNVS